MLRRVTCSSQGSRRHVRRPRRAAVAVCVVALGVLGYGGATAVAHWYGFTQEAYYCDGVYVHPPNGGVTSCAYLVRHTWGFASATHQDTSGVASMTSGAKGWSSDNIVFSNSGSNLVRSCFEGVYPNCHDQDSVWLYPFFQMNYGGGSGGHAVRGHGWY